MEASHPYDNVREFLWVSPLDLFCLHVYQEIKQCPLAP